jgi:hypothetical protein
MLQYIKIGNIELGVDGNDTYYQVYSNEDSVDYDSVFCDAMNKFYSHGNGAGSYYCHHCRVLLDPLHDNKAIVIVQHRYDV